ncbi:universal stress protein [Krasilnikoviella flava]|uniref:Nucleotide-binding universal stress protein, UspA family n=1 Tax=Krasilnikoviella flava TaxID=526729 RepID=A0A1T5K0B9_9MICO|nr:universal stress protein [Krasilnikoviella flava]SKC57091.1 Nucleotide-binding universal stress protein, UspA family [Krasilnikoviella flava]
MTGPVLVGVPHDHRPSVPRRAADLAAALGAELLCVTVDEASVRVSSGGVAPVDPDAGSPAADDGDAHDALAAALAGSPVPWRLERTAGDPAAELARLAAAHDAVLIVVGARRPGVLGWATHLVGGTVAGRLVHDQPRPVVVLPDEHADDAS